MVRYGVLQDLPGTGKQLVDEMIVNKAGNIPVLLQWMLGQEATLQSGFLQRFRYDVLEDTRQRFMGEAQVERLREDHGIYLVFDSRMNVAGLTPETIPLVAKAVAEVMS